MAVCGNRWKYGRDVCVLEVGHRGTHQTTEKREAHTYSWFDSEGVPAEEHEEWERSRLTWWERDLLAMDTSDIPVRGTTADENIAGE
jgi:hypothetical protein